MTIDPNLRALATEAASHWKGRIVRLISHRENAVFEMSHPLGRAALRLHRPGYQRDSAIESELWWCAQLAAQGLAVPSALQSKGGYLVTLPNGQRASAIDWVEGAAIGSGGEGFSPEIPDILALHQDIGAFLQRFHRASDRLTLPTGFDRHRWDIDGLVGEAPLWGRFWDHPAALPEQRAALIAARDLLREKLPDHQHQGGDFGLIHADLLRENLFVNKGSLSLIDFDDSGFGFRLYDLGTVLLQNLHAPDFGDIRDALMRGYGTDNTAMVEIFTLARSCASVGWTMPRLAKDDAIHKSHIARACRQLRRILP